MSLKPFFAKLNRRDTRLIPRFSPAVKFFIFLFFVITSVFFIGRSLAQTNVLRDNVNAWKTGGNLNTWLGQDSLQINAVGLLDALTDIKNAPADIINGISYGQKLPFWIPGGLLGSATNTIASLYNPPASGIEYLAQMKDNFLGKPAYAQNGGIGFQGLQPILPIWKAFRNMVYILSSIVFIIIGVMIMLRVKISPQAVINLQNAIPQLITALILVTFSYAIAGLIIDFMYVIQSLVLALIFSGVGKNLSDNLLNFNIFSTDFAALSNFNLGTFFLTATANISVKIIILIGVALGAAIGAIVGLVVPVGGQVIGAGLGAGLGAVLFALIISIILITTLVKFLFGLVKCYISLIIKIVTGPLEIGMGALPNSKIGFGSWLMDIIANISVFPISLIFLILFNVIAQSSAGLWTPGIIGITGVSGLMPLIISLGGLMLLPKLPEMIPEFIFKIKPSPWGKAIGEPLAKFGQTVEAGTNQAIHNKLNAAWDTNIKTGTNQDPRSRSGKYLGDIMELLGKARSH